MKLSVLFALLFGAALLFPAETNSTFAQELDAGDQVGEVSQDATEQSSSSVGEKIDGAKERLDTDVNAQEATNTILTSIRSFGDTVVAMPGFYWIAFALFATGFVSFFLQLILGKLIMLTQFHFSLMEIMSDGLGLLISALGLALLTQAGATDDRFVEQPSFVLTAVAVGAFFGLIFYFRGQTQELREARALAHKKES